MLMRDLSILVRQMRLFSSHKQHNLELGFPEQLVLMYISTHGEVNQEQIAVHFEIDKGAIAKTVKKLEDKKFILRCEGTEDKREKKLSLSAMSLVYLNNMQAVLRDWEECVYEGISPEERQLFEQVTARMAENSARFTKLHKEKHLCESKKNN